MTEQPKRNWVWIQGIGLCAALAGVFWAVTSDIGAEWVKRRLWPDPATVMATPGMCFEARMAERAVPVRERLTIVMARIGGDPDGRMTRSLLRNLETAVEGTGMALDLFDCPVLVEDGITDDRRAEARARARDWLKTIPGDAMIWGWAESDTRVTLRIVSPEEDRRDLYGLDDDLTLNPRFFDDIAPLLVARAATLAAPAYENGKYVVPLLQSVERRLAPLAANPPKGFGWEERGRLLHDLGTTLYRLGLQTGESTYLDRAVSSYRAALLERTRERVPLDWAMTQNNLGSALSTLGERESGTGRLEESVSAYRAALLELTRERVPLDWAATQNNLGTALWILGSRESGTGRLEESVSAYRAALLELTRERVPLDWAATQNNLGTTLRTLGSRESGTGRLEESVSAYRAALLEWTRERVPLDWAVTQNNLGNALATLGSRESGTGSLEESVLSYRAALLEQTRKRVPLEWAATQNNLGAALQTLGSRESGTARLQEAVSAYRAALLEWTRERVPLDWAMSTGNQGVAKVILAERKGDAALAGEAVQQIETAMTVMREGGHAPYATHYEGQLPAARTLHARLLAAIE